MKIITLNTYLAPWSRTRKQRLPLLVAGLLSENPDIVLLQEVFLKKDANYITQELYPYGYQWSFYTKSLLTITKTPLDKKNSYHFSSYGPLLSWAVEDVLYAKPFHIIETTVNGTRLAIANCHLLSAYGHDEGKFQETRRRQAVEVLGMLTSTNVGKLIMAGDLNIGTISPTYNMITEEWGFCDPLRNDPRLTITSNNLNRQYITAKKMESRIDHILIKGFNGIKTSADIVFTTPIYIGRSRYHISDHFGISLLILAKT